MTSNHVEQRRRLSPPSRQLRDVVSCLISPERQPAKLKAAKSKPKHPDARTDGTDFTGRADARLRGLPTLVQFIYLIPFAVFHF